MFIRYAAAVLLAMASLGAQALQVQLTAKSDGADQPVIWGTTNLPDGTAVMVTVERPQTGYEGDQKAEVLEGKFKAGPFRPASGLSAGTYRLTVMTVAAGAQPASIRGKFGSMGDKLQGKLIKRSQYAGRQAVYTTSFQVSGKSNAKADAKQKADRAIDDKVNFCLSGCQAQGFSAGQLLDQCMRACMRP